MSICFEDCQLDHGYDERFINLPIVNLPPGTLKVRRRVRKDCYPIAFVKTAKSVTRYWMRLNIEETGMELSHANEANATEGGATRT